MAACFLCCLLICVVVAKGTWGVRGGISGWAYRGFVTGYGYKIF